MEDDSHRHLSLLDDFTLYLPDRSEQSLNVTQREDTLLFSETKQDTAALLKAWLASSVALEVSQHEFSMVDRRVAINFSPQIMQSPLLGETKGSQDKIIKTLIAYADNEENATLRRANKDYRDRLDKKLKSISKQICKLACTRQAVDVENTWKNGDDLEKSLLILLLLDDNFVNSDFCSCPRLNEVIKKHARTAYVIPIYLRPCLTESFLFNTLPFYPLKLQGAVSQHNNKDTAFEIISQGIMDAVRNIRDNILPIINQ